MMGSRSWQSLSTAIGRDEELAMIITVAIQVEALVIVTYKKPELEDPPGQ